MNERKGFTLVELLAVIVILAVIMIIAIPSVLQTMTVTQQKTFLEYFQKIYITGGNKYLEQKSFGNLKMTSQEVQFIFDIKDLGISSTGSFKGYYLVYKCTNETACLTYDNVSILLYNEDYYIYKDHLDTDGMPTAEDIISVNEVVNKFNLSSMDELTLDMYTDIINKRECNTLKFDLVNGATGEVITSVPAHPDAWNGKECVESFALN